MVEAGLWLVAAACAFWSTLWVLGPNGVGRLHYGQVPRWLDPLSVYGANGQALALPSVPVRVADHEHVLVGGSYPFPRNYAAIFTSDTAVLQGLTTFQQVCYVGLHVLSCVAVGFIAITLARLVADSRGESPFRLGNVARLRRIGVVLLLGAPIASFATWASERWLVESSSMGDKLSTDGYRWSSLPWWTMLVGAAVLVLADVWKRGVQMAEDVRGLV
jgi:hypothetical protein